MDAIEIPTKYGPLVIPNSKEARRFFREDEFEKWFFLSLCDTWYLGVLHRLEDNQRFIIAAVAAELWLREAERFCPFGYDCQCGSCSTKYSKCYLSADAMREHIGVIYNASAARAWGKKGKEDA